MAREHSRWSRLRALTCGFVGLTLIVTLTGATSIGPASEPAPEPDPGTPEVIPYHEHPAANLVDRDQQVLDATRHLPEFGGAYVDSETGVLQVWQTEPSLRRATAARAALAETLAPGYAARQVEVREADYTFAQLYEWRVAARALLGREAVHLVGIDETSNRLMVAISTPAAAEEMQLELESLGIPAAAVDLIQGGPFTPNLEDDHRPLRGGTEIKFQRGVGGVLSGTCSMGFTAHRDGITGFVTNAHCSRTQGAVDDGRYWQAHRPVFDGNQVGIERVDPPFFVNGPCDPGRICRFSDANFVENFPAEAHIHLARIARPPLGQVNWNGTDMFRIMDAGFAHVPDPVTRVGRTNGRQSGNIIGTCLDIAVDSTNITLICQDLYDAPSGGGDSGGPVFMITDSPNLWDVRLIGIHWGGGELADGTRVAVLSAYPFVNAELGGIDVCPTTTPC